MKTSENTRSAQNKNHSGGAVSNVMTSREIIRSFLPLAIPLTIQAIFTAIVSATDSIMVGMLNQQSMTAVTLATQIPNIFTSFVLALCVGCTVLMAQYFGEGNYRNLKRVMYLSLQISLSIGFVIMLLCILIPGVLMNIYTSDPALQQIGVGYLRLVGPSMFLMSFSQIYMNVMKNTGMAKLSSVFGVITVVLNIGLNYIFIFGAFGIKGMGASGAALSTTFCYVLEVILTFIMSRRNQYATFHFRELLQSYRSIMGRFMRYTLPKVIQTTSWIVASSLTVAIIGHQGNDLVSAAAVAMIVINLCTGFVNGYASAAGILTGQMMGRSELENAKRTGNLLMKGIIVFSIVIGGIVVLLTPSICTLFKGMSPDAQHYLKIMLWLVGIRCVGKYINGFLSHGVFSAGGDINYLTRVDIINMWAVVLPLGFASAYLFKLPPIVVYIVLNMDEFYKLVFMIRRFRQYKWVKNLTKKEWADTSRSENMVRKQAFLRSNIGFMFIGYEGRISMVNEACASLLGMKLEDLDGSSYKSVFLESGTDSTGNLLAVTNQELADIILEAVIDKKDTKDQIISIAADGITKKIRVNTMFIEEEDYKVGVFVTMYEV